ncbi:MAG: hypothetical protein ACLTE2_05050 [Eubacteriales bacterium]
MSADLHCHTKMSDGSVTIEELLILAKNKGIHHNFCNDQMIRLQAQHEQKYLPKDMV